MEFPVSDTRCRRLIVMVIDYTLYRIRKSNSQSHTEEEEEDNQEYEIEWLREESSPELGRG